MVVGDLVEGWPPHDSVAPDPARTAAHWRERLLHEPFGPQREVEGAREALEVVGGYLERLPLACVKAGLADHAEIWHFWRGAHPTPPLRRDGPLLARRVFALDRDGAPFASGDMLGFLQETGAPHILVVLGLGIDAAILQACANSLVVYNSIDAPALRVPPAISKHFDLVLTGAEWQSDEVRARHPDMPCLVLPIGPDFADPQTFRPLDVRKEFDLVYVAAAQDYKRHDILFDALEQLGPEVRALCVFGYGEKGQFLREEAARRGLSVEFVGPPGVSFEEVNALMNRARIGLVCGVDDGAPAILTEYMLAGLPVLANTRLACGLQYIEPRTGRSAPGEDFAAAIRSMLANLDAYDPRAAVLERWIWPRSVGQFAAALDATRSDDGAFCCGARTRVGVSP